MRSVYRLQRCAATGEWNCGSSNGATFDKREQEGQNKVENAAPAEMEEQIMHEPIQVGDWVVDIDRDVTIATYCRLPLISERCSCAYCRNYVAAVDRLPPAFLQLLDRLGIDPRREAEVYEMNRNDDGTHYYGGFYHCVGRIMCEPDQARLVPIAPTLEIWFTGHVALVPNDFPPPVLQIEFTGNIPWVLDESR